MLKEIVTLHAAIEGRGGSVHLVQGTFKRTALLLIRCEQGHTAQRIELAKAGELLKSEWQYTPADALEHIEQRVRRSRDYARRQLETADAALVHITALKGRLLEQAGFAIVAQRLGDTAPSTAEADDQGTFN
jgi:hypothetical protein